jgi:UDP-N-acetylmuramoyl-tripeptide--D-alanyl-D-alanine ligase
VVNGKNAKAPTLPHDCSVRVTREELEKSIDLGTKYIVAHQKPLGNFDYEYDWKKKTYSTEDNAARQSGALWGLSLLDAYYGPKAPPVLPEATKRGIKYFDDRSKTTSKGWRYPVYKPDGDTPDGDKGGIGMAALVTLGIVDYVRTLPPGEERTKLTARANEYLAFLAGTLQDDGLWPGEYRYDSGEGVGLHSPYSDGEALLALVIAMKYLARDDLRPVIEKAAAAGHKENVDVALAKTADSATTKGYYQWSSMAYYELATSPMGAAPAPYGNWLMALADWIIDVHNVGDKLRNTAYAYEGIVSAYAWAKQAKDPRAEKYFCAIHRGLAGLMSWQVGHPRASALGPSDDPKAIGGVQNHATEPPLRIDVVQHQMHATMMTIAHVFDAADQ